MTGISTVERPLDVLESPPGGFDDCTSNTNNSATVNYLLSFGLPNLQAKIGTPTTDTIHNKMVLVSHGATKTSHISSINGSENSSKNNREFGLQITSSAGYTYYKDVFEYDWVHAFIGSCTQFPTPTATSTPTIVGGFTATVTRTPTITPIGSVGHLVISQIYGAGGNVGGLGGNSRR